MVAGRGRLVVGTTSGALIGGLGLGTGDDEASGFAFDSDGELF